LGCGGHRSQMSGHGLVITAAGFRQLDLSSLVLEETNIEMLFQLADLLTHGGWSDEQFLRREPDASVSRDGIESTQRIQGWQLHLNRIFDRRDAWSRRIDDLDILNNWTRRSSLSAGWTGAIILACSRGEKSCTPHPSRRPPRSPQLFRFSCARERSS